MKDERELPICVVQMFTMGIFLAMGSAIGMLATFIFNIRENNKLLILVLGTLGWWMIYASLSYGKRRMTIFYEKSVDKRHQDKNYKEDV